MPDPGQYRCWVEISRTRLRENYRAIKQVVGPDVIVCPVIKADAYRHGATAVAEVLEQEGAEWFAVSSAEEGISLRECGVKARLLIMADFLPASRPAFIDYQLTPVLHHLNDIAIWNALAPGSSYHLKIDSGMGRLGTNARVEDIVTAIKAAPDVHLEGLMSHFASSADYDSKQTDKQLARFQQVATALKEADRFPAILHLASTIPVAYARSETWQTLVRPGHAIYGYVSPARGEHPSRQLHVRPVLHWYASVLTVKHIDAGDPVGYGAIFRATKPMRIAVISAGYADGLPHRLGNRGHVIANATKCSILGAVSMDVTTIDVTDVDVQPGDRVTLIGDEHDAQEMAREAGTISYAALCGISARVRRVYID